MPRLRAWGWRATGIGLPALFGVAYVVVLVAALRGGAAGGFGSIGELPDVREVVVVGVDDEAFGQRLAAYVVPTSSDALDADTVRAQVKSRLAGYKVPRDVVFLDELPRNASGKVVVRDLPGVSA